MQPRRIGQDGLARAAKLSGGVVFLKIVAATEKENTKKEESVAR